MFAPMRLQSEFPNVVDFIKKVRAMRALQIDHYNSPEASLFREMVRLEDQIDNQLAKLKAQEII